MTVTPSRRAPSPELVQAAVEGRAGWAAVRSIVTDPWHHGGLALLAELPPEAAGGRLELVRTKYKPGHKLTGSYRLVDTDRGAGVDLAVSWHSTGRVSVLRFPEDPAMPQLARLSDPPILGALVDAFHEPPSPGTSPAVRAVRYRPGQRHILQAWFAARPPVFVKTDREDSGARSVPVARFLATALERRCPAARVVEPLGYSPAERAALWWQADGTPATGLLSDGRNAARFSALVGRVARIVHDSPGLTGSELVTGRLGSHDVEAEAAATVRAGEHVVALLPAVGRTYTGLVAAIRDELGRLDGEPGTLIHGDLKADNLRVDGRGLRVLDLDRARRADPAIDLGKFLADLRWWLPATESVRLEAAFRAGYGACEPARWSRALLLAPLFQLRLAARRAALHDDRWEMVVRGRVLRAVESFASARQR